MKRKKLEKPLFISIYSKIFTIMIKSIQGFYQEDVLILIGESSIKIITSPFQINEPPKKNIGHIIYCVHLYYT